MKTLIIIIILDFVVYNKTKIMILIYNINNMTKHKKKNAIVLNIIKNQTNEFIKSYYLR